MEYNLDLKLNLIRNAIGTSQIKDSFEMLIGLVFELKSDYRNQVILLYSDFNYLQKKESLGIGDYHKEKNRIILALLEIVDSIEKEGLASNRPTPKSTLVEQLSYLQDKIELLEKNIQLLLRIDTHRNNSMYLSLRNSSLWSELLPDTKNTLKSNSIILNEQDLDNYLYIIQEYLRVLRL